MNIVMPQLGETVSEGTVAAWHKKAGDAVEKGEILLDVETDKVATEIPAPATGVLQSISVEAGDTVDVGTVLAVILVEGQAESGKPLADAAATADSPPTAAPAVGLPQKSATGRLSPAVRRLLKQHNLDDSQIDGSGRDGRVTRDDVLAYIEGQASPAGQSAENRIPFDRIRKTTAEHMLRSKATSPHVLQTIDVDFSGVDAVRLARREQWRSENGYSLSYLPFVARALCLAIVEFPKVNSSVAGDALLVHRDINLAIAIDLDFAGLVAPVVRNAGNQSVTQLAGEFHALGGKAKAGELTADDLTGGTYTLSNPGPFGTLFTAPIINQPQVGILSMDAVKKRPVVVEENGSDTIAIRPVGILAHSFDHRAIDGAYSAAYLNQLKTLIEQFDWHREL